MKPETFQILFLAFFILEAIWEYALSMINIRWITARSEDVPEYLEGHVSSNELKKAADYATAKNRIGNLSALVESTLVVLFIYFGLFGILDSFFADYTNDYLRTALFFSALMSAQHMLETPISYYSTFVIEERFGFNKTTRKLFWADWFKGLFISLLLTIPLLLALVWFLSSFELWWLYSWALITVFMLVMTLAYPRIIAPLFNKFSPLEPGNLADAITDLMKKCRFSLKEVKVMDASRRSGHSNAYFTGLGKIKRIVLFDTLISGLKEPEIISVLAHEVGHFKKKHMLKVFILIQVPLLATFFILDYLVDQDFIYAGLGLNKNGWSALLAFGLIVPLAGFWLSPFLSWYSRKNEYEADAFAKETVGTGEHLSSALISLSKENLNSPEPHPLFVTWHYSHPTIGERISRLKGERGASESNDER